MLTTGVKHSDVWLNITRVRESTPSIFVGQTKYSRRCSTREKSPHICGGLSLRNVLTRAYNAYVKREGRIVHSDSMKIRMLMIKLRRIS